MLAAFFAVSQIIESGGWMRIFRTFLVLVGLFAVARPAFAQEQKPARPDLAQLFEKREVMIPMRDGVKLFTCVYAPKDTSEKWPILFDRTPYSLSLIHI